MSWDILAGFSPGARFFNKVSACHNRGFVHTVKYKTLLINCVRACDSTSILSPYHFCLEEKKYVPAGWRIRLESMQGISAMVTCFRGINLLSRDVFSGAVRVGFLRV